MRPALASALLLACLPTLASAQAAYKEPWAVIERGDNSDVRKEAPVAIASVDGVSTRDPRRVSPVSPGKRVVKVSFSSAHGTFGPRTQDVTLDVAPCMRYRIVARYEGRTGGDWKPHVYTEPLGECRKKFPSAGK